MTRMGLTFEAHDPVTGEPVPDADPDGSYVAQGVDRLIVGAALAYGDHVSVWEDE